MNLRSIELRGFKSFAEPVKLPLSARLIGVVGPNGCGKSNIADAFRWIMGEQKGRLLRIEKAENLIFNGTAHRKALPFAEVTLEVENFSPELPRLAFTRRVHRSGESEYFLNGTPARMKDFLSYFWQVGLTSQGVLDGGQVEALIHDRGGARRALIESLAGIERYHHHKKEMVGELEKTTLALNQVEGLLSQLREQAEQLAAQAEKVEIYKKLRNAYQELLLSWISQELSALSKTRNQQDQQVSEHAHSLRTLEEEIGSLQLRIESLEAAAVAGQLQEMETTHERMHTQWQELLREESTIQERQRQLERQLKDLEEEIQYRGRQREELHQEESLLREKRQHLDKSYTAAQEALSSLMAIQSQTAAQLQSAEESFRRIEAQKAEASAHLQKVQSRLRAIEANLAPVENQLASYASEKSDIDHHLEQLASEKQETERKQKNASIGILELQSQLTALEAQRRALYREKERQLALLQRAEAYLKGIQSQKSALQALLAQAEGWPSFFGELRKKCGVAFWRTEDIFFTEGATLPLLGFLLRLEPPTLWVHSEEDAQQLHRFLVEQQEGFFAVRVFSPQHTASSPTGTWIDRLQTLEGFEGLAHFLWGDIEIREEEKQESSHSPVRVLSKDGRVMYLPDGYIYHLSPANTAHIGLPHRIQRLSQEEKSWTQRCALLRDNLSAIEKALSRLPLPLIRQRLHAAEADLRQVEKHLAGLTAREEEKRRRKERLAQEIERLEAQRRTLQEEKNATFPSQEHWRAEVEKAEEELQAAQKELASLRQRHQQLQKSVQEQRFQLVHMENEAKSTEKSHKLITQQLEEIRRRMIFLQGKREDLLKETGEAVQRLQDLHQKKQTLEPQITELASQMKALRERQREIESQLSELRPLLVQKQKEREALLAAISRVELRRLEVEQREALLHQRLSVELQLSPADLPPPPSSRLKTEEVESRLAQIKQELSALGELNFEAAASLDNLRKREQQLLMEKRDIEASLSELQALLHTLDREAKERFLQAFDAVRERFKVLFQGLFAEGDTCDLLLIDPEAPLSSEIEIVARPKGKKPLSLQQLSGGEKALTALALLFATFVIRPSAICILDEVDAPLDDVNTHKFGQLLRRFSEETPLLVITHNKVTMSYCDQLFGVTMPEPGVSAVLAVEMSSAQEVVHAA
ncbi:MAG: chromosome segregation protein SMC [Bacteroidia bacterium]|nr:chromosome segregation protein SMC [Bacteroidia bacterium]